MMMIQCRQEAKVSTIDDVGKANDDNEWVVQD